MGDDSFDLGWLDYTALAVAVLVLCGSVYGAYAFGSRRGFVRGVYEGVSAERKALFPIFTEQVTGAYYDGFGDGQKAGEERCKQTS